MRHTLAAASAALLLVGGTACSSDVVDSTPPTIPAATPAVSPPALTPPAGVVRPLTGTPTAATFDAGAAALVVLVSGARPGDPASLVVMPAAGGAARTVGLPAAATAATTDGTGRAYLSTRGGYLLVELDSGNTTRVDVTGEADTDFTAITRRADGRVVLGTADGAVAILADADAARSPVAVSHRSKIFARVDSLASSDDTTLVLDRGQTSVTAMDAEGNAAQSLRAGEGATTMVVDDAGRVLVTDTRGDELLVFSAEPLIMRQRFPVSAAPYGLAGSDGLSWVSQTASNTVIGYDLSTGIPVEKVRHPTVQQPNSLGYDAGTDTLYVVSGSGAGVQIIARASGTR
ncbi:hypothetical protein A5727_04980 [Mycobacterium sp. ACS4331]|nr:hypothetical protein A5727_04980 [Mycobacterium sp. ACS4331]